jgi:hypothetical protein
MVYTQELYLLQVKDMNDGWCRWDVGLIDFFLVD